MKIKQSISVVGQNIVGQIDVVEDKCLEEMESEMSVITYNNSPVSYEFLNTVLIALGTVEGEADSSGEKLYLRSLIERTEALMEKAYD